MTISQVADGVLDALIVPSFTKIGPAVRSRLFDWVDPDVNGTRIAITGPTSGLGKAAALRLAELGAELILIGRNPTKLDALTTQLDGVGDGPFSTIVSDLGDFESVRSAGEQLGALGSLDVLAHNGGALHADRTTVTGPAGDEIELTLATHVVAPFLMTALALPALEASDDGRIITMSSGGMYSQALKLDDLQTTQDYSGTTAYARAKRGQVDLSARWSKRLATTSVTTHAMHPGWAATPGVTEALPGFDKLLGPLLRSPEEGADTLVWLCGAPADEIGSGHFWLDRRRRPTAYVPGTKSSRSDVDRYFDAINTLAGSPV